MAHEEKRFQLRPVDDEEPAAEQPVVRLRHGDEPATPRPGRKISVPAPPAEPSHRLPVPEKSTVERRSHEPSVEAILGQTEADPEALERAWGGGAARRNPIPWGWFVLIGLVLLGAVFWGLATMREGDEQIRVIRHETAEHFIEEEEKDREAEETVNRLETSIRSMFSARNPEEMAAWVRHPDRVLPLLREFYGNGPPNHGKVAAVGALQPVTLDRRADFWTARVILSSGRKQDMLIEVPEDGTPRIDWETMVCHQPMPWDEFARQRPRDRSFAFRVYAEPDTLYSHEFANSSQWRCYRLTARGSEETLYGYVRTGGAQEEEIERMISEKGGQPVSVILRLLVPQGLTSPRGVVIEKILSRHWVYIDPPDTDTP